MKDEGDGGGGMQHRLGFVAIVVAAVSPAIGGGAQTRALTPAEVGGAADAAKPGDTLSLADGLYADQTLIFRGRGAEGKPITLRAATPGKVRFTGRSSLRVEGEWLVVDGLVFER